MIVFIDESYQQDALGTWHYALAGFGINEFKCRMLQAAVYQLIRKYFARIEDYDGDSWRTMLNDKIIVNDTHDSIELKSAVLLNRGVLNRFGGEASPHYRLAGEVLTKVSECRGTCLGVLSNPIAPQHVKNCANGCPHVYVRLIDIIGRWMTEEHPGQTVTLVLDTEHNAINLPLSPDYSSHAQNTSSLLNIYRGKMSTFCRIGGCRIHSNSRRS